MHFTYKKKIFLYFLIVFTIFTVIIVAVQQNREKMYKSENFKASLNAYAEIIANYVDSHRLIADKRLDSLNNLLPLLPRGLRVSIIDRQGGRNGRKSLIPTGNSTSINPKQRYEYS